MVSLLPKLSKVSSISEEDNKKSLVYVLQFINIFDEGIKRKSKFIPMIKARANAYRVYKSLEKEAEGDVLPRIAERKIEWLRNGIDKKDIKKSKISLRDYYIGMLSTVLYTIKHELGIEYELLMSRDDDEIFCKLYVTEYWLKKRADDTDYHLKFRKKKKWDKKFQMASPYGPFSLNKKYSGKGKKIFNCYDEKQRESDEGTFFTYNDKVRLLNDAIYTKLDLYVLKNFDIMIDAFPIHENASLNVLKKKWATLKAIHKAQPLDDIKNYYSESIALYFAWMGVYAIFMGYCAAVGLIVFIILCISSAMGENTIYTGTQVFFCLFLAIWASFFDQFWTREERKLAWKWGTANMTKQVHHREKFEGKFQFDEVTGKMKVLKRDSEKRNLKKSISFAVIGFLIAAVIAIVIAIFRLRVYMKSTNDLKDYGSIVPAIVYAIQISIFDLIYSKVSIWLNNLENHETTNDYNNNLALKLFLFRFINSYCGLFYIAFIKMYLSSDQCTENGCMWDLGLQLSIIFITNMILNIIEIGLPWFLYKFRVQWEERKMKKHMSKAMRKELLSIEIQSKYEPYENPIEDYMEMALQFGFIALFGSSFPLLPILAFIEIILEIRVDAWKLCNITRRPDPVKCENIGIWKNIVVFIAYFGAITNSGIVVFTSGALNHFELPTKIVVFFIIEHLFIFGIATVSYFIPDSSKIVNRGIAWCRRITQKKEFGKLMDDRPSFVRRDSLSSDFSIFLSYYDMTYHEH
ncbi:hypothetical protein SteCoe_31770 [Stentor coeruleus]|uniref:Anoctamin dimerisation domain-containing protein n=1 Tax=Stentor coeruleus TaxID=5963 RepID=A0A1R2B0I1_9CILI|nr:hypothetical protein SteCoe_31770 [Stentor coeruleus]